MFGRFHQIDVFTATPFEGNQLAVFENGDDIPDALMPVLAREMNFPETVFLVGGAGPGASARLRIFTPEKELPMAGHPAIGTTFLLAALGAVAAPQPTAVLDLKIGPTPIDLIWHESGRLDFAWMHQRAPEYGSPLPDTLPVVDTSPSPASVSEGLHLARALHDAIATQLTPHQRRVVLALVVEEVPIDVLADRLGTNRNALYKALHDARRRLRQALTDSGHLETRSTS